MFIERTYEAEGGEKYVIRIKKRKRDSRDSNKDEANGHEHAYYLKGCNRRTGSQRPIGSRRKGRKKASMIHEHVGQSVTNRMP